MKSRTETAKVAIEAQISAIESFTEFLLDWHESLREMSEDEIISYQSSEEFDKESGLHRVSEAFELSDILLGDPKLAHIAVMSRKLYGKDWMNNPEFTLALTIAKLRKVLSELDQKDGEE